MHRVAHGVGWTHLLLADFREPRQDGVRLRAGPMGQDFLGSCAVTSRNPLIHEGATNPTRSTRFDAEGVAPGRPGLLAAALEGVLATPNFREFSLETV